jgi:hypothetical protein
VRTGRGFGRAPPPAGVESDDIRSDSFPNLSDRPSAPSRPPYFAMRNTARRAIAIYFTA